MLVDWGLLYHPRNVDADEEDYEAIPKLGNETFGATPTATYAMIVKIGLTVHETRRPQLRSPWFTQQAMVSHCRTILTSYG
jgi:hypothetical protein